MVTFNDAMAQTYGAENVNLILAENVYKNMSATSNSAVEEAPIADVRSYESSWQNTGSTAVVVLTRWGTEDSESAMLADGNGAAAIERVAMPSQARGDDGVCIQQGSLSATGDSALS